MSTVLKLNNTVFDKVYSGIDELGNKIFVIESSDGDYESYCQNTKELKFDYNVEGELSIEGNIINLTVHILKCITNNKVHVETFEMLVNSFFETCKNYRKSNEICDLFNVFVSMFTVEKNRSDNELQGFFAELYFIYYLRLKGCDIAQFWQKKEKMKFDFDFSENNKLDVKSTTNSQRLHHFRHEQLCTALYDIKIASLLIRKSDTGLSILELITKLKQLGKLPHIIESNIALFINNTKNYADLNNIRYDEKYIYDNLLIYDAFEIPKFNCREPNGVSKTEYDSDLSNIKNMNIDMFIEWVKLNKKAVQ